MRPLKSFKGNPIKWPTQLTHTRIFWNNQKKFRIRRTRNEHLEQNLVKLVDRIALKHRQFYSQVVRRRIEVKGTSRASMKHEFLLDKGKPINDELLCIG